MAIIVNETDIPHSKKIWEEFQIFGEPERHLVWHMTMPGQGVCSEAYPELAEDLKEFNKKWKNK